MFENEGPNVSDQIAGFLAGDRANSPFSSWVHYLQMGFVGLVVLVYMFGGAASGG